MSSHRILPASLLVLGLVAGTTVFNSRPNASEASKRAPESGVIVSTDWLAQHISDPGVVILRVTHMSEGGDDRIPGSHDLSYMDIIVSRDGNSTEIPDVAILKNVFEGVGVSDDSHVVLYGEPMMYARAFFTFDYLGLKRISVLDGGLDKWKAEKRSVTRNAATAARGHLEPHPRPEIVANADWIMAHRGLPGVSLIDTRTDGE